MSITRRNFIIAAPSLGAACTMAEVPSESDGAITLTDAEISELRPRIREAFRDYVRSGAFTPYKG